MKAAALIAWRERLHLSQAAAAALLGCGRRSVQVWESGVNPIPKYIALACAAVALGISPPPEWER